MREKWTWILLISIIIQAVLYAIIPIYGLTTHEALIKVAGAGEFSVFLQVIGYIVILRKTKDMDTSIYRRGRPPKEPTVE